ncbi:MAG: hypothetical protein JO367_16775 [Actinobacteria bacterium]|nr:hypothetical protein [Actinomycetota bacterium]MBV9255043.1 hypothetical protein [Actinomycetota bacterium]MBV9935953.1 hypothetical protein [Actinomycetota bacterium]
MSTAAKVIGAACAVVLVMGAAAAALHRSPAPPGRVAAPVAQPGRTVPPSPAVITTPTTVAPVGPVMPTGCPPPPRPPQPPQNLWHPPVLVPEAALPAPPAAPPRVDDMDAVIGKGVWTWKVKATEGGDADAIVQRAKRTGLRQLWVRVGDSQDGFYAADFLSKLLPAAHRARLSVIGWGYPYLYDPEGDARWSRDALDWRASTGDQLDGFSADIESAAEGTTVSARRVTVYLGELAPAKAGRPLIATVFTPTDRRMATYPYAAMAPYVDVFAPMVYWGCVEPGAAATQALQRLSALAPVHVIGQAYDMGPEGGRVGSPSAAEVTRFLDVAQRAGATGASFWDWQEMTQPQWDALSGFDWPGPRVSARVR